MSATSDPAVRFGQLVRSLAAGQRWLHVSGALTRVLGSEVTDVKKSGRCPKCESTQIEIKSKRVWPMPTAIGALTVDLYLCSMCGYIETYQSAYEQTKKR